MHFVCYAQVTGINSKIDRSIEIDENMQWSKAWGRSPNGHWPHMKHAVIAITHSSLSYPSRGAAPDILGHVRLIRRRLSARMSVDEPPTRLDILAERLHVERSLQCNATSRTGTFALYWVFTKYTNGRLILDDWLLALWACYQLHRDWTEIYA